MTSSIVNQETPLLEYLLKNFPQWKKTRVKQLLKFESVLVNGRVVTSHKHALKTGDKIEFLDKKTVAKKRLESALPFPLVYEDESLLVIDKPAGLLTMGTDEDKIHTAYYALTEYVRAQSLKGKGRIFIVHRLDRDTSGLVVFAKKEEIKIKLQEEWKTAVKKYYAVVEGVPRKSSDTIESFLVEDNFRRVYSTGERSREAKHASTFYRVMNQSAAGFSLLDVTLITGRKNQIRVHLADIGHPVVGDQKYGATQDPLGRLGLHAYYLSFKHPATGEIKTFTTPIPKNW